MSIVHLRQVDLNLLVVLDVLLQERSVTRAAERLHVTRSAVSHALGRLRELFGDELLIRDGRGLRPTVRAQALSETLPRLLQHVERTLAAPDPFDPATSTRTFRLVAPDFVASILPRLLHEVGRFAPSVAVELVPLSVATVQETVDGRHDALVAPSRLRNDGLRSEAMGAWPWVVYGRSGHPGFADWSLAAWAAHPHLQVRRSSSSGQGPIERRVVELGVSRAVGAVVPHFTMAAPILAQTDLLLTVPSCSMASAAVDYGLESRDLPFDIPPMGLSLFRSATLGDEPGVRWFQEQVAAATLTLADAR